jgi:hypothetical protein
MSLILGNVWILDAVLLLLIVSVVHRDVCYTAKRFEEDTRRNACWRSGAGTVLLHRIQEILLPKLMCILISPEFPSTLAHRSTIMAASRVPIMRPRRSPRP